MIGDTLKRLRTWADISTKPLAEFLEIPEEEYIKIEANEIEISEECFLKLSALYLTSPANLRMGNITKHEFIQYMSNRGLDARDLYGIYRLHKGIMDSIPAL